METCEKYSPEYLRYLELLSKEYKTQAETFTEIINLQAIVNLPKGTEHFMSDLHGEYEAFYHILNNCSGVIREKVEMIFANSMTAEERDDLLTLIYYPKEKLDMLQREKAITDQWAKKTLSHLIRLVKLLSSKYTRSKVRKAMPKVFRFVIDELLHAQPDEDKNRRAYHMKILNTILETGSTRQFIYALTDLIKRLAVDHLHIIGDIYDRGPHADKIMDYLMHHHSLDIQWGNHDILWMGAAAGSEACIANALRNNIRYHNMEILESGYGISLRPLAIFALDTYKKDDGIEPMVKAINVILSKLEGQVIIRHPEYNMDDRLMFHKIDWKQDTITLDGQTYELIFRRLIRRTPTNCRRKNTASWRLFSRNSWKANGCSVISASYTVTARCTAAIITTFYSTAAFPSIKTAALKKFISTASRIRERPSWIWSILLPVRPMTRGIRTVWTICGTCGAA